jgi:steroid delta-isomerase-like uncharacterized protein
MAEDLKAKARRFNDEVMSQGKLEVIDELVAEDFVDHQVQPPMTPDRDGLRSMMAMFRSAFPDLKVETLAVALDGDELWVHSLATGTHQGDLMGIPATGKSVSFAMMDRIRVRDGKAVEHWGVSEDLGMMTQLGVVPEMG